MPPTTTRRLKPRAAGDFRLARGKIHQEVTYIVEVPDALWPEMLRFMARLNNESVKLHAPTYHVDLPPLLAAVLKPGAFTPALKPGAFTPEHDVLVFANVAAIVTEIAFAAHRQWLGQNLAAKGSKFTLTSLVGRQTPMDSVRFAFKSASAVKAGL